MKALVGRASLEFVPPGSVLGVGTGSTVNHFIAQLAEHGPTVEAAVSSSEATTQRLTAAGIEVVSLNDVDGLAVYIDGADECDPQRCLIKGGGGALTREKIVAAASEQFVCIVDDSKLVNCLGNFPLPVEVIPMARKFVARVLNQFGGNAHYRTGFVTDNGNEILDVAGLQIEDPVTLEQELNAVPGIVTVGLFARRAADVVLVGGQSGVRRL